jgi:citrate lyase subunit beta/citryl-CoA lyase
MLTPRWLSQTVHLTCPATVWKYVEAACTKSDADLVMLDLEDSIPRGDDALLTTGRAHVVQALRELDWGDRLRFFRPRGAALDPHFDDVRFVMRGAGSQLEGVMYPKAESPDEVRALCDALTEEEARAGLAHGSVKVGLLVESVLGEECAFALAAATPRLACLVFGSLDYFASLGISLDPYDARHPALDAARLRVVKAAASRGVPAIAEMTVNYPTRDKSPEERAGALAECKADALHARRLGFVGKWVGIPAQAAVVREAFAPRVEDVARSVDEVRAFREAERSGRGAVMIAGKMADRASDRAHRVLLRAALAAGRLDPALARELEL